MKLVHQLYRPEGKGIQSYRKNSHQMWSYRMGLLHEEMHTPPRNGAKTSSLIQHTLNHYHNTTTVSAMREQLGWSSQQCRENHRFVMMFKIHSNMVAFKQYITPVGRPTRHVHAHMVTRFHNQGPIIINIPSSPEQWRLGMATTLKWWQHRRPKPFVCNWREAISSIHTELCSHGSQACTAKQVHQPEEEFFFFWNHGGNHGAGLTWLSQGFKQHSSRVQVEWQCDCKIRLQTVPRVKIFIHFFFLPKFPLCSLP